MGRVFKIFTDGACSGNPGPAAIGFVVKENNKSPTRYFRVGLFDFFNKLHASNVTLYLHHGKPY